jgi:hypothetical protein
MPLDQSMYYLIKCGKILWEWYTALSNTQDGDASFRRHSVAVTIIHDHLDRVQDYNHEHLKELYWLIL